jgi:hypothetical protein
VIKEAFVAASNLLKLYINGKDLNPDSQELPKVQITGLPTECIIGTVQASGTSDDGTTLTWEKVILILTHRTTATQISCNLVMPESAPTTTLALQVQVQTRFGLSRTAKASFPACSGGCSNGGNCWWSKDKTQTECVCPQRYYGDQCQNGSCRSCGHTSHPPCAFPTLTPYWSMPFCGVADAEQCMPTTNPCFSPQRPWEATTRNRARR